MPNTVKQKVYSKELFFVISTVMSAITAVNILVVTIYVFIIAGPTLALIAFASLITLFLVSSFHFVDPRKAHKWMPMIFGKLVNHLGDPGWIFIPFKGLLFLNYVTMYGGELERVFPVVEVVPGDRASISIPCDLYVIIDPDNPARIIEVGGLEAAITRLENIVIQRLRYWITSPIEGPQTMDQARQMRDEAINAILEALLEDDVRRIPSEIPTEVLYGIYKGRTLSTKEQELKAKEFDPLPQKEKDEILELTKEHVELIRSARHGHYPIRLQYLGLIVDRFGVNNIEPVGSSAEDVAMVFKAKMQAEVRLIHSKGNAAAATVVAAIPGFQGDAYRAVLISEGIIKEEIKRIELPEVTNLLAPLATKLADNIGRKE